MPSLNDSIVRAADALTQRRHPEGYWEGRLASSPLATAVALCALAGDDRTAFDRERAFDSLRNTQNADGGWGDTPLSKSNLAATILVLCADSLFTIDDLRLTIERPSDSELTIDDLRLTIERPSEVVNRQSSIANRKSGFLSEEARSQAEAYVTQQGGLHDGLRRVYGKDLTFQVPIRMTAAYCKFRVPSSEFRVDQPETENPERGTRNPELKSRNAEPCRWRDVDPLPFELSLAPRAVMGSLQLPVVSYALPALVCVGLARHAQAPSWFLPVRWLRSFAAKGALEKVLAMQPQSGGFLEAVPITAFCLIGLMAAGRGDHAIAQNARRFLIDSQREDGSWPVEVHLSIWNTTRAVEALGPCGMMFAGLSGDDMTRTREWLLAQQSKSGHVYTATQPGGWGWNHLDGSVPDADDTSGAVLALSRLEVAADHAAMQAAARWLIALQNRDGGWPTFCRGWQKLPFDQSAPDLTAHALRALAELRKGGHPAAHAGWRYLSRVQRADGSFAPLWFGCESAPDELNATYGTAHVLFACAKNAHAPRTLKESALNWLRSIQNADGGFGGAAGAKSTAEETGLALRALCECGAATDDAACQRAALWLIEHQRADGSWDPAPIGFYFAVLWYYEELYPLCYALGGLSAWAKVRNEVISRGDLEGFIGRLKPSGRVKEQSLTTT